MGANRPNFNKLKNPAFIRQFQSLRDADIFEQTFVNLNKHNATDLDDVERFCKLRVLHCSYNQIVSLKPLAGLSQLKQVNIGSNLIEDLSPLVDCPQLKELNIESDCPIRTFDPLRRMPQTKKLTITKDLVPVLRQTGDLPHLREIVIRDSVGGSVMDLPEMPALRSLLFWNCELDDLDGIQRYAELVNIMGWGNKIKTVKPLSYCSKLTHIRLNICQEVDDLEPLLNLRELRSIAFGAIDCARLGGLSSLPKLRDFSYSDLAPNPKLLYQRLRPWDDDFACDAPSVKPSPEVRWVNERQFRYYDTEHPFNVEDYDWNKMMLESECYWVVGNIRDNLLPKLNEEKDFEFWNLEAVRRSIAFTLRTNKEVDFEWTLHQIQRALCRAKKTWILFLAEHLSELWIYPDHVKMIDTRRWHERLLFKLKRWL